MKNHYRWNWEENKAELIGWEIGGYKFDYQIQKLLGEKAADEGEGE